MSTNPFDDHVAMGRNLGGGRSSKSKHRSHRADSTVEPPIWAARNVEWPIPSSLSLANYQKLVKSNKTDAASTATADRKEEGGDEDSSNYLGLGGLMSRVLNTSGTTTDEGIDEFQTAASSGSTARLVRAPRPRCVATSNGWIVSALEVATSTAHHGAAHATRRTLVSRWNVRRGSSISTDPWLPLPGTSEIVHVFVDPTGCHTLLSAHSGETYYLHSSSRSIQKIFGHDSTGGIPMQSGAAVQSGVSATMAAMAHQPDSVIQVGLTRGSYITAVAWDKETGTEGSSKSILLGTSAAELYEYTLDAATIGSPSGGQEPPVLLHKLYASAASNEEVAQVTGVHFERLAGAGMIVLVSTSGRHKRTRLFTFHSFGSHTSFRSVLAQQSSLVELPGSIDFADFRLCNEHFALRTATGIYYGTIDRNSAATGTTGVIVDAGMLTYDDASAKDGSNVVPVSIALTPHHLITLTESDEVRFINRVARQAIQKERVDWVTAGSSTGVDESLLSMGELMMDIRRPDQVWLRNARSLVHISSTCEDRDVWKYSLAKCLEVSHTVSGRSPAKRPGLGMPEFVRQMSATPTIPVLSEEEKAQEAMFEHAKSLCTNTTQKAVVTAVRAEYHLLQGRTELAAKYMAQCPPTLAPFAGTSIRLSLPMLGVDDPLAYGHSLQAKKSLGSSNLALITYLSDKMRVAKMNDDSVACTMVGAWLTELYLHEKERTHRSALGITTPSKKGSRAAEASSQALLTQFLTNNVNNMDAKTIMRILASHDVGATECSSFAAASGDIGTAVNASLGVRTNEMAGAQDALRILNDATFEVAEPYYYKHAPLLLARAPTAASESFLARYSQGLSPAKLLPSIMRYEKLRAERGRTEGLRGGVEEEKDPDKSSEDIDQLRVEGSKSNIDGVEIRFQRPELHAARSFVGDETASINYLEGVIKAGCRNSAVFTYLVSLYTGMEDEEPLLRFLSVHIAAATTILEVNQRALHAGALTPLEVGLSSPLDMSYALRAVLASGRHFRSAIRLYMGFGMRQQAVELALNVDPPLARELARKSVDEDERKRLWLMISRNAASGGDGRGGKDVVARVVSVLKDCGPDVLSIEDVLPFLPDFAQIDQIKDEICDALTSYSSKIEGFIKEMNECDQTCEALRNEITRLRSHRMQMKADARCALSKKLVLNAGGPFYVFPSGYVFLESALRKEVIPHLNKKQALRVEEVVESMADLRRSPSATVSEDDETKLEAMQAELDGLIAAECPLTGSIMVDSIDHGFADCLEADEILASRAFVPSDGEAASASMPVQQ